MSQPERKYDLYSHEMKADPYPTFTAMRRDDPLCHQPGIDGETTIWFATRYADVEKILTHDPMFARDIVAHRPDLITGDDLISRMTSTHMLNKDGADHRRLRALVTKAFTPRRVREMRPRVEQIAAELIDGVLGKGEMDLLHDFAFHLPTIVILEMLGIPTDDREKFKVWSNAILMPALEPDEIARFTQLMEEFIAYLRDLFEDRRQQPTDDMISALVHAEEEGDQLSEEELFSMLVLLIVAGHETTVSLITNAMIALWKHPEQLERLRQDPGLMPIAVEEFLRYDGSVERALARHIMEDADFGGQTARQGGLIIPILAAANRDPAAFEEPDKLDISRSPNPHLAFGKGVHYCLGAPLARMEAEIALNSLLQWLPGLAPRVPLDTLRYRLSPGFRTVESLPVQWRLPE